MINIKNTNYNLTNKTNEIFLIVVYQMNENKIKNIIEWLVSIALKFRLRKTYWSIATPLGLFLLCELAKTIDFPLKLSTHLYETTEK